MGGFCLDVRDVLRDGTRRARTIARATMEEVKECMGLGLTPGPFVVLRAGSLLHGRRDDIQKGG
nr:hypothetical protein [Chloroflexota bacterium]